MLVFEKIIQLQNYLQSKEGLTIGFVPTMGALHRGHISLVERSKKENDITVVSIFVNPTQFNNPDDLKKYPRTPEKDLELLEEANTDVVFMPVVEEMYTPPPPKGGNKTEVFNVVASSIPPLGGGGAVMEGKHRPGHFNGVVEIVSKFFEIIKPNRAYFGEKDFQQLFIIRQLVKQKNYLVEIIGCSTLREANGLAMSSRNARLTEEEKTEAGKISKALFFIRDNQHGLTLEEAKTKAIRLIEDTGKMKTEYLEIADEETLDEVAEWDQKKHLRAFAAVQLGEVRLIDNVKLS